MIINIYIFSLSQCLYIYYCILFTSSSSSYTRQNSRSRLDRVFIFFLFFCLFFSGFVWPAGPLDLALTGRHSRFRRSFHLPISLFPYLSYSLLSLVLFASLLPWSSIYTCMYIIFLFFLLSIALTSASFTNTTTTTLLSSFLSS